MLKAGIKGTQEVLVTEANTAKTMGSGTLDVFATPAMIALMELTAWKRETVPSAVTWIFTTTPRLR